MGCLISQLAAKFAFFPPTPPTYQVKKRDDGKLVAVSTTSSLPITIDDSCLDVLAIDTKRGNKIVAFYLRNPYARLTVLYSHGNAADLGQLYDLFVQLKANLRVNLIGSASIPPPPPLSTKLYRPFVLHLRLAKSSALNFSTRAGLQLKIPALLVLMGAVKTLPFILIVSAEVMWGFP